MSSWSPAALNTRLPGNQVHVGQTARAGRGSPIEVIRRAASWQLAGAAGMRPSSFSSAHRVALSLHVDASPAANHCTESLQYHIESSSRRSLTKPCGGTGLYRLG